MGLANLRLFKEHKFLVIFVLFILALFSSQGLNKAITGSGFYFYANFAIFIGAMAVLFFLLARRLARALERGQVKIDGELAWTIAALAFSILVMVLLDGAVSGRFLRLQEFIGADRPGSFEMMVQGGHRGYSFYFFSALSFLGLPVSTFFAIGVNKVLSIILLMTVYLLSRKLLGSRLWAMVALLMFTTHFGVMSLLVSIEYGLGAVLFTYLSVLFLAEYTSKRKREDFILSALCLIFASYYRFELSLLFGLCFVAYFSLFLGRDEKIRKPMTVATLIVMFIMMGFIAHTDDAIYFSTGKTYSFGLIGVAKSISSTLENNVVQEQDLLMSNGNVSLLSYLSFLVSICLIGALAWRVMRGKAVPTKGSVFYLLAFYSCFFLFFQLFLDVRGLRTGYQVNYFLCEILLTFYGVSWAVGRLFGRSRWIRIAKTAALLGVVAIALVVSIVLSPRLERIYAEEAPDMYLLRDNVEFDRSCAIVDVMSYETTLRYYFGANENSVEFGAPPDFYENLERYDKRGKCFYYYEEFYTDYEYSVEGIYFIDAGRVDSIFSGCKREVVFNSSLITPKRPFTLRKYVC